MKRLALAIFAGAILLMPNRFAPAAEELCGSGEFLRFEPDPMEDVPAAGRKALVVGVGTYKSLKPLTNPANDARDMAAKLRRLGFGGACGIDVSRDAFVTALGNLRNETTSTDTAFVYFAGHGASVNSDNYLALTNTDSNDPQAFRQSAVGVMDGVVQTVFTGRPRRLIVVTDACRDKIAWKQDRGRRGDGAADSFLPAPIPLEDQDPSLFIGYGTGYGMWADDGSGTNGAFTAKLVTWLDRHVELDLRDILEEVEDDLREEGREQRPERVVYGFGDRFYPRPPAPRKAEFDERAAMARRTVLTNGCKHLRLVAGMYEEWRDNRDIAADYHEFLQELADCLQNPPEPLLVRLSEVTVADASTIMEISNREAAFPDFPFGGNNSMRPAPPAFPDFPLGGSPSIGGNLPPPPRPPPPAPPAPPAERATIRFTASNEISEDNKRILDGLVDRAGDRGVTVAAVVPGDDTFAAIEAHARIATVLESLTSAGTPPERIKLVISPSGFSKDEIIVNTGMD